MDIKLTDEAKKELAKLAEQKDYNDKPLRIYLAGYGWAGPSFAIALDELKDGDVKSEVDNFTFIVEEELVDTFPSFTVDYSNSWLRRGFLVIPS